MEKNVPDKDGLGGSGVCGHSILEREFESKDMIRDSIMMRSSMWLKAWVCGTERSLRVD